MTVKVFLIRALLTTSLGLAAGDGTAAIRLPRLVSDNMVLQRDAPIGVWGWANPGERVTITFRGSRAVARTDAAGRWQVTLPAQSAGGPSDMTLRGENLLTVKNILLGDVWLASGQSNMQFPLVTQGDFGGVIDAEQERSAANFPALRLFQVRRTAALQPRADVDSSGWVAVTPETVGSFSAIGYLFARELHQRYGIPIGVIDATWGGTPAETWMSSESLHAFPDLAGLPDAPPSAGFRNGVPQAPALLFNGMISPMTSYCLKGVIWYQGEANVGRAAQYALLFPALIRNWRAAWGRELPFLFVQLAGYGDDPAEPGDAPWADLREAQSRALALPGTGMATAVDVGDAKDVHPKNKQAVAHRLALAAFKVAYGEQVIASGPTFRSLQTEGGQIRIHFNDLGAGLTIMDAEGRLRGFAVAAAQGGFVWAQARVDGDTVVVGNAAIAQPVAVRYDWSNTPHGTLYNREGLPAPPFRTDGAQVP